MAIIPNIELETKLTLHRLLPRLEKTFEHSISTDPTGWAEFQMRLKRHFPKLFNLYVEIYNERYDLFFHLEDLVTSLVRSWFQRPTDLRALDNAREENPLWFQSNQMLGGVCYVDLFAENLEGVKSKIPYFKELGITLSKPQGLTRASAEGKIDRATTFDAFLSRRSAAEQDAQLGAGRAQLWRDGKITLRQLVDNAGNPLTIEQLRSKYE